MNKFYKKEEGSLIELLENAKRKFGHYKDSRNIGDRFKYNYEFASFSRAVAQRSNSEMTKVQEELFPYMETIIRGSEQDDGAFFKFPFWESLELLVKSFEESKVPSLVEIRRIKYLSEGRE